MNGFEKATNAVEKACQVVATCLLVFICIVIVAQVVVRKLGGELIWVDEMTRYAFMWLVLFGSVSACRRGEHITITSFLDMLPDKLHQALNIVIWLVVAIFSGVLGYAYFLAISSYEGVTFSVLTSIPMGFHYGLIGVLMILGMLASVLHVWDIIRSFRKGEVA